MNTEQAIEATARAICSELARQDGYGEFHLRPNLTLSYLDQGEVDFGLVARAALSALNSAHTGIAAILSGEAVAVPKEDVVLGLGDAMAIAGRGLLRWAEKEHNARWWRKIDGTPMVNDIPINIAEEFVLVLRQRALASPYAQKEPADG